MVQVWSTEVSQRVLLLKSYKKNSLLFFDHDYLNDLVENLVNLFQDRTHVIWKSTSHDLSNQKPSKDQLIMHQKLYYCQ